VCPWRLNEDGKLGPDLFNRLSPDELDPVLRTELIELLQIYQRRWVVTGPCLDGGWYAAPRHDQTAPRVLASSLADLRRNLHAHEHRG
jgi:hypothetical protein